MLSPVLLERLRAWSRVGSRPGKILPAGWLLLETSTFVWGTGAVHHLTSSPFVSIGRGKKIGSETRIGLDEIECKFSQLFRFHCPVDNVAGSVSLCVEQTSTDGAKLFEHCGGAAQSKNVRDHDFSLHSPRDD